MGTEDDLDGATVGVLDGIAVGDNDGTAVVGKIVEEEVGN